MYSQSAVSMLLTSSDQALDAFLELPFSIGVLRPPKTKFRWPRIYSPGPMAIFGCVFFGYFLMVSGIMYDVIIEPPSIGYAQDPTTKQVRPVAFLEGRINGQYIIEGLSAGFLYCLGGFGLILVDLSQDKNMPQLHRYLLVLGGMAFAVIAYNLILLFLRIKVPNYLF